MTNCNNTETIRERLKKYCAELNLSEAVAQLSMALYETTVEKYSLEGDTDHWLCCSIYTISRTTGKENDGVRKSSRGYDRNCVSLTNLLRVCHLGLYEFCKKMKLWTETAPSAASLKKKMEDLEHSIAIATVIHQKYEPLFNDVFSFSANDAPSQNNTSSSKYTSVELYELCWCLFLCARCEYSHQSVDLVTSFHLLLCAVDLVFFNVASEKRMDLINPHFQEFAENSSKSPSCIITELCKRHEGSVLDAVATKNYSWKNVMNKMYSKKVLKCNQTKMNNILTGSNFEINKKSLSTAYKTFIANSGDFDERLFLANDKNMSSKHGKATTKENQHQYQESIKSLVPGTPLTRRHCLPGKDTLTPVATATQSVDKLRSMLSWYNGQPQRSLRDLFEPHREDIEAKLVGMLAKKAIKFNAWFQTNFQERFLLAEALFYQLLEYIVREEMKKQKNIDHHKIFQHKEIPVLLIACCVEIVIYAYNSQQKFPWILECFDLTAFEFYKIIELVVLSHQDLLTRDVIKHLNKIEEQCMESLVWNSDSALWTKIQSNENPIPSSEDVGTALSKALGAKPAIQQAGESIRIPPRTPTTLLRDECTTNNQIPIYRSGSLKLFFRKFYHLAFIRIHELCKGLELTDIELVKKIWTIFEHSIVEQTELMKNRHLDQLLMCAIYVFIRVTKQEKTFRDIMQYYRNQPQSASEIYRNVLIGKGENNSGECERRGDIIEFYNNVYVVKMQSFALRFTGNENLVLSPLPSSRANLLSPRKVSNNHLLYVQQLEKVDMPESPNCVSYSFTRSPAKDFTEISKLINNGAESTRKRLMPIDPSNDDGSASTEKRTANDTSQNCGMFVPRKLHNLIKDRQENNSNKK